MAEPQEEDTTTDLGLTVFDSIKGRWEPFCLTAEVSSRSLPATINLVTYNIWFDSFCMESRLLALLDELARTQPHVIALQEVTHQSVQMLQHNPWVQQHYLMSPLVAQGQCWYGVALLVRVGLPVVQCLSVSLPTELGRAAAMVVLGMEELIQLAICTAHFESYPNGNRSRQFRRLVSLLSTYPSSVISGDTNIHGMQETKAIQGLCKGYIDVWPALYPRHPGLTFDASCNPFVNGEQERLDRFYLRSDSWRPTGITMLGRAAIPKARLPPHTQGIVFPSDHFGLHCSLVWQAPPRTPTTAPVGVQPAFPIPQSPLQQQPQQQSGGYRWALKKTALLPQGMQGQDSKLDISHQVKQNVTLAVELLNSGAIPWTYDKAIVFSSYRNQWFMLFGEEHS